MASDPPARGAGGDTHSDSDLQDSPPPPGGRRGTRREKNRVAAQKSRQKQTQRADVLHQESETLEQENAALRREIETLRVELRSLDHVLQQHEARCYHTAAGPTSAGLLLAGPSGLTEVTSPVFSAAQPLHAAAFSARNSMATATGGTQSVGFCFQPNGDFKFPYGS